MTETAEGVVRSDLGDGTVQIVAGDITAIVATPASMPPIADGAREAAHADAQARTAAGDPHTVRETFDASGAIVDVQVVPCDDETTASAVVDEVRAALDAGADPVEILRSVLDAIET